MQWTLVDCGTRVRMPVEEERDRIRKSGRLFGKDASARIGDPRARHSSARRDLASVIAKSACAQSACGTTAVTSISTFARASISALTSTALIATS